MSGIMGRLIWGQENLAVSNRFEELDDDDIVMGEAPDAGVLIKTLRNVGFLVAVCIVIALVIGQGTKNGGLSDRGAGSRDIGTRSTQPAASQASQETQGQGADSEMVLRANANGHFVVEAEVNGTPITFVVDTGATDIIISADDAARAGFRPHQLNFSKSYRSANGIVRGAPVRLRSLRVGQIEMYDVEASVNEVDIGISLLGVAFLSRLDGYQVEGNKLVMAW